MATPQEQLAEAEQARHQLILGKAKVSLSLGDRRVEYAASALKDLDNYIAELRRLIAGKRPARGRINYVVPY